MNDFPVIIGRNDGCDACDEVGHICEDCVEEWIGGTEGEELCETILLP